jgi:hypothetical protein
LSTSTSVSTSKRGAAPAGESAREQRGWRLRRLWWLLPILLVAAVFEPHSFRWLLREAARLAAWQHGVALQVGRVGGSVLEPVTFFGAHLTGESGDGTVVRVEVQEATARFSWRHLFKRNSTRWLERVTLDGVAGKMTFPVEPPAGSTRWRWQRWLPRLPLAPRPGRVEVRGVDFIFQSYGDYVRLEDARCTLSEAEPGVFIADAIVVKQPWLQRTFRELRGTTRLDGAEIGVAEVTLEPGVKLDRLTAELDELARGNLNAEGQFSAFDGRVRFQAQTLPGRASSTEIMITPTGVNVAKLATFLATPNAAGGTIRDGLFSFRGSPHRLAEATGTLRIDATNFQWDARQWDSLVLGARLVDGRLEVPQLVLLQGKNRLDVDGEFSLPAAGRAWWQSAFDARIKARIEDLTALSALLLPEFRYAAGQATIEGAIRGREESFDGQLVVSGSNLQWRSAPIEELQAALKFAGAELQVTNLAIFNDGDFVRGRGRVNLRGPTQYSGVLRAAVQDLATYAALLQPPIVPEPLAGGATVSWQGEGSAQGHRGSFRAQLNKLRSRGASAALLHPINAALEGAYAPGKIRFDQFALSDDESSFTANVAVGDKGVSLRAIELRHKADLCLEGDAVLPLDVWKRWPNTSLASLLDDTAPMSVQLTAHRLGLREAAALTGWNFPIAGTVSGPLTAEGTLGALTTAGRLTLTAGRIPLGWGGPALTDVEGAVRFEKQTMRVEKFAGRTMAGHFRTEGSVDFTAIRNPTLKLTLASERTQLALLDHRGQLTAALAATIEGTASAAAIRGEARPLAVAIGVPELSALWREPTARAFPEVLSPFASSLAGWTLDVACATAEPLALEANPGRVSLAGRIVGTCAQPRWVGQAQLTGVTAAVGDATLTIEEGTADFRANRPRDPSLSLAVTGAVHGEPFRTHFTGPLSLLLRDTVGTLPLDDAAIRTFLIGDGAPAAMTRFSLQVPAILSGGAEVYEWAEIP